ncbi:electron transport complex subunit RsxB [Pandoraea sp.]|uniref:electron transport complex subunit RsxB n=1 Tax=Pandoraea sp. TaxID=1883445 RepID=UPI0012287A61|nr:electron transport complex subunit RsxB [Pandoraea sp.]TAL54838.1 MAG: electron transport complex subunit RsxB [Pandoraea sp.]TAM18394.1 MAG: electron transport complex subunit RsxB [Pandoraea sp.]
MTESRSLADHLEDALPQTQCTKCGYDGCRPYAEAMARGQAQHNQCPPGGAQGVARLANLLGKPPLPLNPANGVERPRPRALIDESLCIGCTLCMQACPVDAIVGAAKQMHTVVEALCTGCDLCVPPCPVDCIAMVPVTGDLTGWDAWSQAQADAARERYEQHQARRRREQAAQEARLAAKAARLAAAQAQPPDGNTPPAIDAAAARKQAIIQAALERARQKKETLRQQGLGPKNIDNPSAQTQAQIDQVEARRRRLGLNDDDLPGPGKPNDQPGTPS